MKELQSWISNKVYDVVPKTTNKCISLRWVLTKQTPDGIPKAWHVARRFKEDSKFEKESPTCLKESLHILFSIYAQNDWKLRSIDIKTSFLQGNLLTHNVCIN